MLKLKLLVLLVAMLPLSAQAVIYKWKDSNGVVRYSDLPPPSNIPYEAMGSKTRAAAPAAADKPPAADANANAEAAKRQQEAEADKKMQATKQAELEYRQQSCLNAKTNYQNFKVGGRMYKMDENGQRQYLGDAEIAAGLEKAQKDMEEFCQ